MGRERVREGEGVRDGREREQGGGIVNITKEFLFV